MPPRKQPSGAANRKRKALRGASFAEARAEIVHQWYATSSQSLKPVSAAQFQDRGAAIELPLWGVSPPTLVAAVNAAILSLEQGQFFAAAQLADGMFRDDRLRAKAHERIDALVGSEMQVDPAKETSRASTIAEDCEQQLPKMLPQHQVGKLLKNGLMQGVGIGQVLKTRTVDATYPALYVWNNRYLRWDWTLRRYCLVTENRGELALDPMDPEWVIYEPYGPHGWMDSAILRTLGIPWLIRYWTRTWWARHQEVHGSPIRVGIIPTERDPADEKLFLKQLANIAHEAVIRLPQGTDGNKFDMKLIEAAANTWEGFEKLLAHCDDSLAIAWLGQKQSTNGQGGLGSQENAGEDTILRLTRSDALIYVDLREKFLKPWTAENDGDPEMAPYLCPQIEPPEDEGEKAKTDLTVGQTLMAFKTAGAPVDQRKYLEGRGYGEYLMTEEEHAAAKQQAMEEAQQAAAAISDQGDEQDKKPQEDNTDG